MTVFHRLAFLWTALPAALENEILPSSATDSGIGAFLLHWLHKSPLTYLPYSLGNFASIGVALTAELVPPLPRHLCT